MECLILPWKYALWNTGYTYRSFLGGSTGSYIVYWDDEMDYRGPPSGGPSYTDNDYGAYFNENGTWLDVPDAQSACFRTQRYSNIQSTVNGISCLSYSYSGVRPNSVFSLISHDSDLDGVGDGIDAFPNEPTQWFDEDLDGYGDNPSGNFSDDCRNEFGNSTIDRLGCLDTDGDGQSNLNDVYPTDSTQYDDSDYDGYGDNI